MLTRARGSSAAFSYDGHCLYAYQHAYGRGRFTVTRRDGRSAHGIAVDPDLIPLGSRLWVPGYGHGIADDIGGRIQGHRVDVRIQEYKRMSDWGVRPVRVYVLADAPEKR